MQKLPAVIKKNQTQKSKPAMTDRQKLALHEERLSIYSRDGGICQACGLPVDINSFQVAHRIANTRMNLKRFGRAVIDSPHNKACTHAGRCNDAMNCGFKPDKCAEIVAHVQADLKGSQNDLFP